MFWLYRQYQLVRDALCAKDTPRQMALGLACGMMLGMVPKGNLLAIAIATVLFGTRMSAATGLLSAAVFSFLSPACDPLTHRLGESVLTQPALVPLWRWISRLPLAAWTSFNNTVVMGNVLLGAFLFYPMYRLTLPWVTRYRQSVLTDEETEAAGVEREETAGGLYEVKSDDSSAGEPSISIQLETKDVVESRVRAAQRRTAA
jgi:uncharacterized protein (TIGR03546 family)